MEGDLDEIIESLVAADRSAQLGGGDSDGAGPGLA